MPCTVCESPQVCCDLDEDDDTRKGRVSGSFCRAHCPVDHSDQAQARFIVTLRSPVLEYVTQNALEDGLPIDEWLASLVERTVLAAEIANLAREVFADDERRGIK